MTQQSMPEGEGPQNRIADVLSAVRGFLAKVWQKVRKFLAIIIAAILALIGFIGGRVTERAPAPTPPAVQQPVKPAAAAPKPRVITQQKPERKRTREVRPGCIVGAVDRKEYCLFQ